MVTQTDKELIVLIQDRMRASRIVTEFGFEFKKAKFELLDQTLFPDCKYKWIGIWANNKSNRQINFSFVENICLLGFCVSNLAKDPMYDFFFLSGYFLGEKIPNFENESMKIPDPKDRIDFIFDSIEKLLDGRLGSILLGKEWVDYPIDYGGYK